MARQNESHARAGFASSTKRETLSTVARERATLLRRFADDMAIHNGADPDGNGRLCAVTTWLLNGDDEELSGEERVYLRTLGADVPPRVLKRVG